MVLFYFTSSHFTSLHFIIAFISFLTNVPDKYTSLLQSKVSLWRVVPPSLPLALRTLPIEGPPYPLPCCRPFTPTRRKTHWSSSSWLLTQSPRNLRKGNGLSTTHSKMRWTSGPRIWIVALEMTSTVRPDQLSTDVLRACASFLSGRKSCWNRPQWRTWCFKTQEVDDNVHTINIL